MSPSEGAPKNPEDSLYVLSLRTRMKQGFSLEDAIKSAEEEIEKSKSYDSEYPQQKAALQEAADYLRSKEEKK